MVKVVKVVVVVECFCVLGGEGSKGGGRRGGGKDLQTGPGVDPLPSPAKIHNRLSDGKENLISVPFSTNRATT